MKRFSVVLFALTVVVSYNVMAQGRKNLDSESKVTTYSSERLNLWSTDVEMNLFGNSFNNFQIEKLKVRRYLNDNTALRFSLGFGLDTYKNTSTNDNDNPNINKSSYYSITHSKNESTEREYNFKIGVGYEYHRDIFDKVDIYAGGEIGYAGYFYSETQKTTGDSESGSGSSITTTTSNSTKNYYNSDSYGNENYHEFYISGIAGVDVYFYKNIYVGVEMGVNYTLGTGKNGYYEDSSETITKTNSGTTSVKTEFSSKTGEGKTVSTNTSGTTTTTNSYTPVSGNKEVWNALGLFIEPSFHIGIRF